MSDKIFPKDSEVEPSLANCPFKVGDRVRSKGIRVQGNPYRYPGPIATVVEFTDKGFKWRLDQPHPIGPRIGWYQEGECYECGYSQYELAE